METIAYCSTNLDFVIPTHSDPTNFEGCLGVLAPLNNGSQDKFLCSNLSRHDIFTLRPNRQFVAGLESSL